MVHNTIEKKILTNYSTTPKNKTKLINPQKMVMSQMTKFSNEQTELKNCAGFIALTKYEIVCVKINPTLLKLDVDYLSTPEKGSEISLSSIEK